MMANTTTNDDLLSMATMGKSAGTALEMNKSDMKKADGGWYIKGYQQNRINIISSYLSPGSSTSSTRRVSMADRIYNNLNANSYYNSVGSNFRR